MGKEVDEIAWNPGTEEVRKPEGRKAGRSESRKVGKPEGQEAGVLTLCLDKEKTLENRTSECYNSIKRN